MDDPIYPLVQGNDDYLRDTGTYVAPEVRVVRTEVHGQTILFAVSNPKDVIQREHAAGRFYELEELDIIARHFPQGGRFLDIGANNGNHSLFVAKFLAASQIMVFEPNPAAIPIFEAKIFLNGIEALCDRTRIGYGLSDVDAQASVRSNHFNLGRARMVEGGGDIPLRRGDAVLAGRQFDLVKIDVEGMEIKVLSGLRNWLNDVRLKLFVEVGQANYAAFENWCNSARYRVLEQFQRYPINKNFLVGPSD